MALLYDINEMYLQIRLKPEDWPYHRFLWRDLNTKKEADEYQFNRVVFGVNPSPFQAQFVAQQHAQNHQSVLPLAADSMDSTVEGKTWIELHAQLSQLWPYARMQARKRLSNDPEILQHIPSSDCTTEVDLHKGEPTAITTLGVLCSPKENTFRIRFQANES